MIEKAKNIVPFIQEIPDLEKGTLSWLRALRREGLSRLSGSGMPTVKNEEWKYTDISGITARKFKLTNHASLKETGDLKKYLSPEDLNIVFVNGILSLDLSNFSKLPTGVKILPLTETVASDEKEIEDLALRFSEREETPFVSLNHLLVNEGLMIRIEKKAVCSSVIHVVHVTSSPDQEIITTPRTAIFLEPSSEATVMESHISFDPKTVYLTSALTDIKLSENAVLHYVKAQEESASAFHIGSTRVWQEQNSQLDGFSCMTGSLLTRNNIEVIVNGEGSSSIINGLYCCHGNQHVDNHTLVDHRFPNCTSNQLYKGILNGQSRAVFNGKIFVKPIAQKTNSYQLNKNLLLGSNCRVDTKPQLEIFADDVKCTHGATIGQLNEDEVFYLQARCIPKFTAIRMLAHGFVDDILNTISNGSVRKKLMTLVEPTFDAIRP